LDDEQLLAALQLRAKQRGLILHDEVGVFLIRRCVRSMPDLYDLLDQLDRASLAEQRRLTIPFIKKVLNF
jgi:DnaA family protein